MNPHEILGVPPGAPGHEVRRAFRRFARIHHPDAGGDAGLFRAGLRAYRQLVGPGRPQAPAHVVFHRRTRGLARVGEWVDRRRRPPRVV